MVSRYMIPAIVLAAVAGGVGYWVAKDDVATPAQAESLASVVADRTPTAENPKVATVGGEIILKSDVDQLYTAIKQRAGERAPKQDEIFWMLVDQIISSRLVIQQALTDKLNETPLVQNSIKMATEQILQEAYIESVVRGSDNDALLKPRYEQLAAELKNQVEVKASHILVAEEAKAREIITQLGKGGDFAKLANDNSIDPGSKERGGDLGYFPREAMVPEFATVAFALTKGQVSQEPVKTQFGWHVIKVEDRRSRQVPSFEEVKNQLIADVQQDKVRAAIDALRAKASIERFEVAGVPPQPKLPLQETLENAAQSQAPASTTP